ncbi:MAG: hypothetical protein Q9162_001299 [Coniocarpon cinnabarinum]
MSEVTFAKQFLTVLDSKPQKLPSDYVADPKKLATQSFILPRMSKTFPKSSESDPAVASQQPINATLSPLRKATDSPAPVTLTIQPKASIYELKTQLSQQTGYASDKVKILWERKPVVDSKTVQEVIGKDAGDVEFAVMYSGAPTAAPRASQQSLNAQQPIAAGANDAQSEQMDVDQTPVAQGQSGEAVLSTSQFWKDLQDFVMQRVRDKAVGKEAVALFEKAWKAR